MNKFIFMLILILLPHCLTVKVFAENLQSQSEEKAYNVLNPGYDPENMVIIDGFAYEMVNKSPGAAVDFQITNYAGSYKTLDSIIISNQKTGFMFSQLYMTNDIYGSGNVDYITIGNDGRIKENSLEIWEASKEFIRLYFDGEIVYGEIERRYGIGHIDYFLCYDKRN